MSWSIGQHIWWSSWTLDELMDIELAGNPWSLLRVLRRVPWDCSIETGEAKACFKHVGGHLHIVLSSRKSGKIHKNYHFFFLDLHDLFFFIVLKWAMKRISYPKPPFFWRSSRYLVRNGITKMLIRKKDQVPWRIHVWYICEHKGGILMVNVTIYIYIALYSNI